MNDFAGRLDEYGMWSYLSLSNTSKWSNSCHLLNATIVDRRAWSLGKQQKQEIWHCFDEGEPIF